MHEIKLKIIRIELHNIAVCTLEMETSEQQQLKINVMKVCFAWEICINSNQTMS